MKRFFALLLSLLMVCSLFAACGGNEEEETPDTNENQQDTQTPENEEPADDGEVKLAEDQTLKVLHSEPNILDVARFLGTADRYVFYNTLEPLVKLENGVIVEAGAETYDISADGLTYTFKLRENYWSDGKKVTSEDYATALRRQADPANAFAFASSYYSIENFEAASKGEVDVSEIGVETPDESTLILHLGVCEPALLSSTQFFPDRADLADTHGDSYGTEADKVPSCGPFILTYWVHNSSLTLKKNEKFWDAENVILETIECSIIPDSNAQYASFENGSIDYMTVSDLDYRAKFEARDDMVSEQYVAGRTSMIIFNCQDPITSNMKIRQALSIAIDRELIVEVIANGNGNPAYGMVPTVCSVGPYIFRDEVEEPLLELMDQDPKALLIEGMEELGLGNDPSKLTLTLSWGNTTATGRTYAELYQQMWQEALGCVFELEFFDSASAMSNYANGDYQIASVSWGCNPEPQFQLSRWSTKTGGQSHWINEEYCNLVSKAASTVDDKARLDTFAEAEKMIIQEAAIAPTYYNLVTRFAYDHVGGLMGTNSLDNVGYKNMFIIAK